MTHRFSPILGVEEPSSRTDILVCPVLLSEPEAVATGSPLTQEDSFGRFFVRIFLPYGPGRNHHPTRAARVGTPVRFRVLISRSDRQEYLVYAELIS